MKNWSRRWLHNSLFARLQLLQFKKHYKAIAKDLGKQQALDADAKAIQKINFTRNLRVNDNRLIFFIIEAAKETILVFFTMNCESIVILICFDIILI